MAPRYTDVEMLAFLKEHYSKGLPLSRYCWSKSRPSGACCLRVYDLRFGTWNNALTLAGLPISEKHPPEEVVCLHCGVSFPKLHKDIQKSPNHYCSRSCAITRHNQEKPKRQKQGTCCVCQTSIVSTRKFCRQCLPIATPLRDDMTKAEVLQGKHGAAKIRNHSRLRKMRQGIKICCLVCGYDRTIDVAHIKPVSKFPDTALISEINSLENLVFLCPNHHRELDSHLLDLHVYLVDGKGFEPLTVKL